MIASVPNMITQTGMSTAEPVVDARVREVRRDADDGGGEDDVADA